MRDYLIIARVGDNSLHPRWLEGERNWDLALSCFGKQEPKCQEDCVLVEHTVGPKWPPLHDVITRHRALVGRYRHVMLPDDDLLFSAPAMSRFFDLCAAKGFAIAQPSLDYASYFSHPITLRRPLLSYRVTDFVEVMTPCFRADVIDTVLPTMIASGSGWGIDDVWPRLFAGRNETFAIVDAVSVTHTRPVGGELYKGNVLRRTPSDDYDALHATGAATVSRRMAYGCTRGGWRLPRLAVRGLGLITRLLRRRDGQANWQVLASKATSPA